jgi:hypothetical protein
MTRLEIESSLNELNGLVLAGKAMEAFDKFYHDDVEMQENTLPPTRSKTANRQRELEFFANVTEFRGAVVKGMGIGDDISFVIWKYDFTHRHWGVRDYTQVSIQQWKEGKIIKETFVYAN